MTAGPATADTNVELVKTFLSYLDQGGVKPIELRLETFCHPDVEWVPAMITYGKERYTGIEEYREYLQQAMRSQGGEIDVQEVRAVGPDRVLALAWVRYTGDGQDIFSEYALLVRVKDGLFKTIRSFTSHAAAASQAGQGA